MDDNIETWGGIPEDWALTCGPGVLRAVAEVFLTTAKTTMTGQLQSPLRAVPAVPGKLVFAFFDTTLGPSRHAAGVDQVSLQGHSLKIQPPNHSPGEAFTLQ